MARITVEDSLKQIPNRFELTLIATYRARMLAQGHTPKVESRNKPTVTALREVAAGQVGRLGHLAILRDDGGAATVVRVGEVHHLGALLGDAVRRDG